MKIPSDYLSGFLEICRKKNLTLASKSLGLTQAALSLRLKNLEDLLEETLLIRQKSGVILTEAGLRLFEHAELLEDLEKECLYDLNTEEEIKGTIRVGCFSTVGRSLILPSLSKLIEPYPNLGFNFAIKETRELPALLHSGEMDIIFLDRPSPRERIDSVLVGHEEYVLVTSKTHKKVPEIYLNHDEEDLMSFRYWEKLGKPRTTLDRRYLDEIYSVIDGVASGIGVSVLPRHLVTHDKRIKIIHPEKFFISPVYMIYKKRSWLPRHLQLTLEQLKQDLKKVLK